MDEQWSRRTRDLLSDLPLRIIHIILSFVSHRDAVRTSLLSKQWRYIWTSLPYLVFDKECVNPPMKIGSDEKRLIDFISQALLLHKGPILKFHLCLPSLLLQSINQWLLFLSMNDVKALVLEFEDEYSGFKNLSSLYSCHNLTLLETIPPMYLELAFAGGRFPEMTIHAPNLKFFRFLYGSTHLSLDTPVLEEFIVNFVCIEHFSFHESMVFHHLRIIKLCAVPFDRAEVTVALIRLITSSPNLQKLKISSLSSRSHGAPECACVSFWDTESVPNFTYDSLKVIKMACGCGIDEIKLAKFLLARSPELERMIYRPDLSLSEQVLLNLTAELRNCRRASANAEIEID